MIEIVSEQGGTCKFKNPFGTSQYHIKYSWQGKLKADGDLITIEFPRNGKVELSI